MGFFDSLQRIHEGVTLSGIPYSFRDILVADTDNLIKDLRDKNRQGAAFQNFAKSLLVSVGGQDPKEVKHFLAEDLAGMLLDMRIASLGDVFDFKYEHNGQKEDFSVSLSGFSRKPYCFSGVCVYANYNDMLAGERERQGSLMGKPFKWFLPYATAKVNEFEGLLSGAANMRGAIYDQNMPNGSVIPTQINWPDAPQTMLDAFAQIWREAEGKVDSSFTIRTKQGDNVTLNAVALPGFFSAALAQ